MHHYTVIIVTLLLAACEATQRGSTAAPVRVERQQLGESERTTWDVTYVDGGGEIARAHRRRDGEPDLVVDYVYEGSFIRESVEKSDGTEQRRLTIDYDANGDVLAFHVQLDGRPWVEAKFIVRDRKVMAARYDIDEGGGVSRSFENTYRYDDEQHVRSVDSVETAGEWSFQSHVDVVHRDGVLSRYHWSGGDEPPLSVELTSGDDGKIREINHSDGDRFAIRYDDEGRVSELEKRTERGAVIRWTFEYADVDLVGATMNMPDLVTGELLDLEGRSQLAYGGLSLGF